MDIVVVGSGIAGLVAARGLVDDGHRVVVVDKGRRVGGRLATERLAGGARADKGAQFFTVRSAELSAEVERWLSQGMVHEWCRGFAANDGHPRYAVPGGMAELPARLAAGLDVRQSVTVDRVLRREGRWQVSWSAGRADHAGSLRADVVVVTTPVPQAAALLDGEADVPDLAYESTLSLVLAIDRPGAVPPPGGVQLVDDPVWSWVGDNLAKGTSTLPSITFHTTSDLASRRFDDDAANLEADLVSAARPWLGGAVIGDRHVQRWRYATPIAPWPERSLVAAPGVVLAGDAFGGPRVEGAYLSGLAVVDALT